MNLRRTALTLLLLLGLAPLAAQARCVRDMYGEPVCPEVGARCAASPWGEWGCSAPGGEARLDRLNRPVCGIGHCVKDLQGDLKCATQPYARAMLNRYQQAVCPGGTCAAPTLANCQDKPQYTRSREE